MFPISGLAHPRPLFHNLADSRGPIAYPVLLCVDPTASLFDHNLVDRDPFVTLEEDTHIIAFKQVQRLNKQQDIVGVKGGPIHWAL